MNDLRVGVSSLRAFLIRAFSWCAPSVRTLWTSGVEPRRPLCAVLAGSVLLAGFCGAASDAARAQSSPAASIAAVTAFRISGRVVNANTGAPLARCSMEIAPVSERGEGRTVVTGEDGVFSFAGLEQGKYSLTASRRGFLRQAFEEHGVYSTAIAVGPGLVSEGIIFKAVPEAILSGTVRDEAGEPVRRAQLTLFGDRDDNGRRTTRPVNHAQTDDRGFYEIGSVAPGSYYLAVKAEPWYAQHLVQSGEPISADERSLDVAYPETFYPNVTDSDAATPIPVKGGDRINADFSLAPQPALRIQLHVPESVTEQGFSVNASQTLFGEEQRGSMLPAVVVSPGVIELRGVVPGHYDLSVNTYGRDRSTDSLRLSGDAVEGSEALAEASSAESVKLTGVVRSEGKLPPGGRVMLTDPVTGRPEYTGELDDAGTFTMSVAPGHYQVVGGIRGAYLASLAATDAVLRGHILEIKPGSSPRLSLTSGSAFAQVDGVARRGDAPASAVMVLLAPVHPGENHVLFRRDQSDSDGTFTLPRVVPGAYYVLAVERGWDLEWARPAVLQPFLAKAKTVMVHPGEHLQVAVEAQAQ